MRMRLVAVVVCVTMPVTVVTSGRNPLFVLGSVVVTGFVSMVGLRSLGRRRCGHDRRGMGKGMGVHWASLMG